MKRVVCIIVAVVAVVLIFCTEWSAYSFRPDKMEPELGIDQNQEGFFILRYMAYRGRHRLGGTLNEISIRNLSREPMKIESLNLLQTFRGRQVTEEGAPIPYDGLNGSISSGSRPTVRKEIAPGEWMSFDFPTKSIWRFDEGDKIHLLFIVSLRSGSQHYERRVEFTKTLMKVQLPPL